MDRFPRHLQLCGAAAACLLALAPAGLAKTKTRHAPAPRPHTHHAPQVTGRMAGKLRLGDGRRTYHASRHQLGVSYAAGSSEATPISQVKFHVDRARLRHYLSGLAMDVRRSPRNAHVVVASAGASDDGMNQVPARIVPGYDGAVLDVNAAVDQIQKTLEATPDVVHIVLPVKRKPARVTTADLKGINARVGYFVTRFDPGNEGRTLTVRRAIDIIDGTVVPPHAIFSVDKTVGPRDPAHGFNGKSAVFIDGHEEMQSGGGMCQVATTLFNAAMLADLKIVERHPHVRTVPYADPGRDATIYHGEKDFRIQNNTDAPLLISYKTTRSHAVVSLYGKAVPGRRVRLIASHRRLGERHYIGTFNRIVYNADGTKQKGIPIHSDYRWPETLDFNR